MINSDKLITCGHNYEVRTEMRIGKPLCSLKLVTTLEMR